jgi:uncharacterized protein YaaQ
MKMVLAVVQAEDAPVVMEALVKAGHRVTRVATTGGWLRRENATLLLGVEDDKVSDVLQILKQTGRHRTTYMSMPFDMMSPQEGQMIEVEVGGATAFVLNVERFEHF